MNIAIASGKGGTGKTTVAVNIASLLSERKEKVCYIDCDVEEPNGHLFLSPVITSRTESLIPVPCIDESKCIACGACVAFCQYRALVRLGKTVMVFDELCHGCGGCTLVCKQKAISEQAKSIGFVEYGTSGRIEFIHGRLNIGEAMSPPLIRDVLSHSSNATIKIIDSPPGTSCPVIAAVRDCDFVVLVTEPTPFGLNDLGLAIDMVKELSIPFGVVINRDDPQIKDGVNFCTARNAPVLGTIPDDRRIAEAYSNGRILIETLDFVKPYFSGIIDNVISKVTP
ncbi:MAG: P-loop NTPase [Fibrobacter sp.]|nr:P-loop NTPase [Fibrobacter sp.]